MEKIWHHILYHELRVTPEQHPVLLAELTRSTSFSISCSRRSTCPPCLWRSSSLCLFELRGACRALCWALATVCRTQFTSTKILRFDWAGRDITECLMTHATLVPMVEHVALVPVTITMTTAPSTIVTQPVVTCPIASSSRSPTTRCALPTCEAVPPSCAETHLIIMFETINVPAMYLAILAVLFLRFETLVWLRNGLWRRGVAHSSFFRCHALPHSRCPHGQFFSLNGDPNSFSFFL